MEVNTYTPVKVNHRINSRPAEKEKTTEEVPYTDATSNEASGAYGQAFLGVGVTSGSLSRAYTPPREYTSLSDEEFQNYAEKIKKKVETLPEGIERCFDFSFMTKDNIFIFDKVLSEERLCGDKRALTVALNAASSLEYDNSNAELKCKLADKLLSDERFYGNETIQTNAFYILSSATTPERYELTDKMLSDEYLCNEIYLNEFLFDSVAFTSDEAISAMNNFCDKILQNPNRFLNDKLTEKIRYFYKYMPEKLNIVSELTDRGAGFFEACETVHDKNKYDELNEYLANPTPLRALMTDNDYNEKIKKAAHGKYENELAEIFNKDLMSGETINKLCLELDDKDFLAGIKKLATSTYKLAMKTPNQYLSDIDKKYTTKVNGKYPKLSEEDLKSQQTKITEFFKNNAGKMIRALKYIDTDTLNQTADRRTTLFEKSLNELDELDNENYKLLGDLIKCKNAETGKVLTAKDKTELCRIVEIFQKGKIDTGLLKNMSENGKVNIPEIKETIQTEIIRRAGITDEMLRSVPKDKLKFNEEYSYLALMNGSLQDLIDGVTGAEDTETLFRMQMSMMRDMTIEDLKTSTTNMRNNIKAQKLPQELIDANLELIDMYRHLDKYGDDEIWEKYQEVTNLMIEHNSNAEIMFTVIRESIAGDFKEFIFDTDNEYGETNAKTKEEFEKAGLDYEQWVAPDIAENEFKIDGKKMHVKFWERNPQEDLFLGNKTTCCTAIGTGINQSAQPIFLLNTAFNVAELQDDEGNTVGMSRAFMGKVNGENALFADNIELNNGFIKNMSDEDKLEIRNQFFDYLSRYAKATAGGEDIPVYFYSGDVHVPTDDLKKISSVTEFTGKISQNKVYINSASCTWVDPEKLQDKGEIEWLVVPNNSQAA